MQLRKKSGNFAAVIAKSWITSMIFVLTLATTSFAASHEKTLYSFTDTPDASPFGGLVADAAGNLYGTTLGNGSGTVFELSPPATSGGAWTRTVLYTFLGGDTDGAAPYGTLIFDNAGNLYGTTSGGGPDDRGTVFELNPPATPGGAWTESVIFFLPADLRKGHTPAGKLAFDGEGNLYGLAQYGGSDIHICDCGTLFELTPPAVSGGAWTPHVIHDFGLVTGDGANPVGDLTYWKGALYGMTTRGGDMGLGAIFQATRSHGAWTVTLLASFDYFNGALPSGGLAFDSAGNIYGVAVNNIGTVYELSPPAVTGSGWQLSTIHAFTWGSDGRTPSGPLVLDKAGNLYGTTLYGGLRNKQTSDNGIVFELSPPTTSGGAWTKTNLHEFGSRIYNDGSYPNSGLIFLKGKFYGTTINGGTGGGTVFSLVAN